MTKFTIGAVEITTPRPSDFSDFINIAKGRSIVSAADWGSGRFELGLSGGLMLRLFSSGQAEVNIISTVNPNEIPPIIVALGDLPPQTPLYLIEEKLRGLRTLHAIFWLAQNDRIKDLIAYIEKSPLGDIERDLVNSSDRLYVESLSYGSWFLALWPKTVSAYKSISSVRVWSLNADAKHICEDSRPNQSCLRTKLTVKPFKLRRSNSTLRKVK